MKLRRLFALLMLTMVLPSCKFKFKFWEKDNPTPIPTIPMNRLTTPKVTKVTNENHFDMSPTTYNSYTSFAKKFTSLMMEINNSNNEKSLGISIPDAYICLAICGVISTDEARNDILSYLELSNMDELRTSITEIISTLATLMEKSDGNKVGGYNLNSVWFNPEKVELIKEKDQQLYDDLERVFDASLYMEPLTSDKANQYIKDNGLKDMPAPKIKLNDADPSAINVMSVYYCLDYFDKDIADYYKSQYQSGNHKMDYEVGSTKSKVDYIEYQKNMNVFVNDNFSGASMGISSLNMSFFLPNDKSAMPSTILDDVLNENYSVKESTYVDYDNVVQPTKIHNVTIKAPYFSLDNEAEIDSAHLQQILPVISNRGAGERIAKAYLGQMYLDFIKQFSVMKFNYDGFYSCSATIAGIEASAAPWQATYEKFDLILNHPYIFKVNKTIRVNNDFKNVPLVIGEIVDSNYKD